MSSAGVVRDLAVALREHVVPLIGSQDGRAHAGRAASGRGPGSAEPGDVTFAIDAEAERFLVDELARRAPEAAFYSEDRGLVLPVGMPSPREVLVVDPIDGTRPALAGLESCCVSVAAAPFGEDVTMGDVIAGCVVEIASGAVFLAVRGEGLVEGPRPRLSSVTRVDRMFWSYGLRGRPARATCEVLAELLDDSSVGGATFELGSAAYNITRLITGQLDAYVEPGPRMIAELPGMLDEFRRVGQGAVLNNSPHDLAAATLCLSQAGGVVTDAAGRPLDDRALLGSDHSRQISIVAAANEELHRSILEAVDAGIARLHRATPSGELRV